MDIPSTELFKIFCESKNSEQLVRDANDNDFTKITRKIPKTYNFLSFSSNFKSILPVGPVISFS